MLKISGPQSRLNIRKPQVKIRAIGSVCLPHILFKLRPTGLDNTDGKFIKRQQCATGCDIFFSVETQF